MLFLGLYWECIGACIFSLGQYCKFTLSAAYCNALLLDMFIGSEVLMLSHQLTYRWLASHVACVLRIKFLHFSWWWWCGELDVIKLLDKILAHLLFHREYFANLQRSITEYWKSLIILNDGHKFKEFPISLLVVRAWVSTFLFAANLQLSTKS